MRNALTNFLFLLLVLSSYAPADESKRKADEALWNNLKILETRYGSLPTRELKCEKPYLCCAKRKDIIRCLAPDNIWWIEGASTIYSSLSGIEQQMYVPGTAVKLGKVKSVANLTCVQWSDGKVPSSTCKYKIGARSLDLNEIAMQRQESIAGNLDKKGLANVYSKKADIFVKCLEYQNHPNLNSPKSRIYPTAKELCLEEIQTEMYEADNDQLRLSIQELDYIDEALTFIDQSIKANPNITNEEMINDARTKGIDLEKFYLKYGTKPNAKGAH